MVEERERPPRVTGVGFDPRNPRAAAAKTGDGIEADIMRVNMRARTVFAKYISEQVQVFAII